MNLESMKTRLIVAGAVLALAVGAALALPTTAPNANSSSAIGKPVGAMGSALVSATEGKSVADVMAEADRNNYAIDPFMAGRARTGASTKATAAAFTAFAHSPADLGNGSQEALLARVFAIEMTQKVELAVLENLDGKTFASEAELKAAIASAFAELSEKKIDDWREVLAFRLNNVRLAKVGNEIRNGSQVYSPTAAGWSVTLNDHQIFGPEHVAGRQVTLQAGKPVSAYYITN